MFYFICIFSICVSSYLIGSVNFSILISNLFFKKEIRTLGSGNAGTTNMLRNFGKMSALFTFLFDFLKGFISIFLVNFLVNYFVKFYTYEVVSFYRNRFFLINFQMSAFLAVVIGHIYPLFYKFKGGKAVATSAGAILAVSRIVFIIIFLAFVIIFLIFRIVSISSIISVFLFAMVNSIYFYFNLNVLKFNFASIQFQIWILIVLKSIFLAFLIIFKHKSNILRFLNGKEPKIGR